MGVDESVYPEETQATLLGFFPYYYTTVLHHSRFENLTVAETLPLSKKTRLLGEFLAAQGYKEVDFEPLKRVIQFVDSYLRFGTFQREQFASLVKEVTQIDADFGEVVTDHIDAEQAQDNGEGAPLVLFTYRYATNLLLLCDMIEQDCPSENKSQVRKLCWDSRRQDPDQGKQPEFI